MVNPVNNNATGSSLEAFVDSFMDGVEERTNRFEQYTQSDDGKYRIAQLETIGAVACAVLLTLHSPKIVALSAFAGVIVSAFSPEQVEKIKDSLTRISNVLPTTVKALAVVIAHIFLPILFPVSAGLYIGLQVGAKINPHVIVKAADHVAGQVNAAAAPLVDVPAHKA